MREIKKKELKEFLKARKGYYNNGRLRKGPYWLANKFNVDVELIHEINEELKSEYRSGILNDKPNKVAKVIREVKSSYNKQSNLHRDNPVFDIRKITRPGTYWITGCVHAPFHNKRMYESTFNFLRKEVNLQGVILDGDVLDMHSISRHNKGLINPNGVTLDWEYKESNKFFNEVDDLVHELCKDPVKHYLYGNHEMWHSIAMKDINNSKYGEALLSPLEGLKLLDRGYIVQDDYKKAYVELGPYLEVNHGEFVNIHSAKKTIDTYRKSVLYFHTHRFQIYMEGRVGGFNMGWGGDIHAPVFNYATRAMKNSWVNGSAIVTLEANGNFYVQPLLFINNKLIINGRRY